MTRWRTVPLIAVALAAATGGCGDDGDDSPLAETERHLAELTSGEIQVEVSATAGSGDEAGPVGFRVDGSFSFDSDGDLPILDLTYTQLLGDDEVATTVLSTGEAAYVVTDGAVVEVPDSELGALRLGDGDRPEGFDDLGIAGWIDDPEVASSPADERLDVVTGDLDVADLLGDLARVVGPFAGGELPLLDEDSAAAMAEQVEAEEVEVLVGHDDRRLERFEARLRFGAQVPEPLRAALGDAGSAALRIVLVARELTEPLVVEAP